MKARYQVSESLELLDQLADTLLDIDVAERGYLEHYSDADIINATIVFKHILSNRFAHNRLGVGNLNLAEALEMGMRIREIVIDMTGLDPHQYFNDYERDNHA